MATTEQWFLFLVVPVSLFFAYRRWNTSDGNDSSTGGQGAEPAAAAAAAGATDLDSDSGNILDCLGESVQRAPCAEHTTVDVASLAQPVVTGRRVRFIVNTHDLRARQCTKGGGQVNAVVRCTKSAGEGPVSQRHTQACSVRDFGDGRYEVSFVPGPPGLVDLDVRVGEGRGSRSVSRSPFTLSVTSGVFPGSNGDHEEEGAITSQIHWPANDAPDADYELPLYSQQFLTRNSHDGGGCTSELASSKYRLRYGWADAQGLRPSMEDAMFFDEKCPNNNGVLFALFDGHGGAAAAALVADQFPAIFVEELSRQSDPSEAFTRAFDTAHTRVVDAGLTCGTTALACLMRGHELIFANAGDSRAVLASRDGRVRRVTTDHKASLASEQEAVRARGGIILRGRVMGMIAIARAIGDRDLSPYLSHVPDIHVVPDLNKFDLLVMACDGVFDVLSDAETVAIVRSTRDPRKAAVRLRNASLAKGTRDNVSVLVISLWDAASK